MFLQRSDHGGLFEQRVAEGGGGPADGLDLVLLLHERVSLCDVIHVVCLGVDLHLLNDEAQQVVLLRQVARDVLQPKNGTNFSLYRYNASGTTCHRGTMQTAPAA
jgi:hypothetical protein